MRVERAPLEIEPGNLVVNPSFEDGTLNNWAPYMSNAVVVVDANAPHGSHAAEIIGALSGRNYFDIDDVPATVSNVKAGEWYRGTAWFSAAQPGAVGKQGFIALRVRGAVTSVAKEGAVTLPASGYVQATVVTQAMEDGELEVYLGEQGAASGDVIRVDLITAIRLLPDAGVPGLADAGTAKDAGQASDAGQVTDSGVPTNPRMSNLKGWSCDAAGATNASTPASLALAMWFFSRRRTSPGRAPAASTR